MRQPLFILGLAFVTAILIANVDAIKCYVDSLAPRTPKMVDCDCPELWGHLVSDGQCFTRTDNVYQDRNIEWGCSFKDEDGVSLCTHDGWHDTFHCCKDKDFCNDGQLLIPTNGTVKPCRYPKNAVTTAPGNLNSDQGNRTSAATTSTPHVPLLMGIVGSSRHLAHSQPLARRHST
ncbi:hypothetical protein AAVH_09415 [Aphelenchoides avenae]|nr:hypothetical protein AAVH_09415 [Aphelenchus avenae]